jgi:hypothetical protein
VSHRTPPRVVLGDEEKGVLRQLGGSLNDTFNQVLVNAVGQSLWAPAGQSEADRNSQCTAAVVALRAFAPCDEIEGMIAAQAIAMHHASMECSRRAMVPEQPFEIAQGFRKAAANASRTFTELLAALDRKRGKAVQQRVLSNVSSLIQEVRPLSEPSRQVQPEGEGLKGKCRECVSAWNRDPVGGVIGVQTGPL